jgi:hypothetical protein
MLVKFVDDLIQGGHTTLLVFVDEGVEVGLVSVGGG